MRARLLTAVVLLTTVGSSAGAGVVGRTGRTVTVHCTKADPDVTIEGGNNVVTVLGDCGMVSVDGNGQTVSVARAQHVLIMGTHNRVSIVASDELGVGGQQNLVEYWHDRQGSGRPRIGRGGKNNKLVAR